MSKYVDQVGVNMRAEVEEHLNAPNANGLARPAASSGQDVRASGGVAARSVPKVGEAEDNSLLERADSIRAEVSDAQLRGADIIDRKRRVRDADTAGAAAGPTDDGAELARSWSKSVPLSPFKRD
jgi:hypothetical protein